MVNTDALEQADMRRRQGRATPKDVRELHREALRHVQNAAQQQATERQAVQQEPLRHKDGSEFTATESEILNGSARALDLLNALESATTAETDIAQYSLARDFKQKNGIGMNTRVVGNPNYAQHVVDHILDSSGRSNFRAPEAFKGVKSAEPKERLLSGAWLVLNAPTQLDTNEANRIRGLVGSAITETKPKLEKAQSMMKAPTTAAVGK